MSANRTVAVVGASADRRKFGNKAVRAYHHAGYDVYPIHPSETMIEGRKVFHSVRDLPLSHLDRIAVYLPPAVGIQLLDDYAAWPGATVFFNPGTDSPEVLAKAKQLGLNAVTGCAIIASGSSPEDFPDD